MRFWLAPRSMTLEVGWPWTAISSNFLRNLRCRTRIRYVAALSSNPYVTRLPCLFLSSCDRHRQTDRHTDTRVTTYTTAVAIIPALAFIARPTLCATVYLYGCCRAGKKIEAVSIIAFDRGRHVLDVMDFIARVAIGCRLSKERCYGNSVRLSVSCCRLSLPML